MKLRYMWLFAVAVAVVACGGAVEEPAAEDTAPATEAAPAEEPMDDATALDEMTEYFVTHYNMHHADMVAELYAEDAVFLSADGSVQEGRAAIHAAMEQAMAGQPTLTLDVADRIIMGDNAVSRGMWSVETTPEGATAPMTIDGHYMTVQSKIDGDWQTVAVITNYDEEPPADLPRGESPAEEPEELADSPLAELADYYATHYNMGHGDMVASRYTEDAVAALANTPLLQGREAIAAHLNTAMAERNPQLTIHEVAAEDLGDGWILGGGWYEVTSDTGDGNGAFMLLTRTDAEGNRQIHWSVSNLQPVMQ